MDSLEKFRLKNAPDTVYYIPDFISEYEERHLITQIYAAPKPKWKQLSNRRLQNWGGLPHPKGMLTEPLPQWLQSCTEKVASLNVFEGNIPNHVLINEYLPGQGIMPHTDGPLFYPTISTINLGSHTLLKFYKPTKQCDDSEINEQNTKKEEDVGKLDENQQQTGFAFSILLLPKSCLILQGSLYQVYHHGIDECASDIIDCETIRNVDACGEQVKDGDQLHRSTRLSLTIRFVPKTLKIKFAQAKN